VTPVCYATDEHGISNSVAGTRSQASRPPHLQSSNTLFQACDTNVMGTAPCVCKAGNPRRNIWDGDIVLKSAKSAGNMQKREFPRAVNSNTRSVKFSTSNVESLPGQGKFYAIA